MTLPGQPRSGGQVRPRGGAGAELLWWCVPGAAAVLAVASTAAWLGGHLAAGLSGHGFGGHAGDGPAVGAAGDRWRLFGVQDLARHDQVWPGVPGWLIWTCAALIFTVFAAAVTWVAVALVHGSRARRRPATRSMATRRDVARLQTLSAASAALRLRPQLADRCKRAGAVAIADRGVTVGRLLPTGGLIQASWEDVIVVVAPPRCGKTTAIAVPAVLDAPGAVVACSNKSDLYLATSDLRRQDTGRQVWTFDPQHIVHAEQRWWWNMLAGPMTLDDATRLAGGFILAVADDEQREIWGPAATELLSNLILAAHLGGHSIVTAYEWLYDEATDEPVQLLRGHGHAAAAASLAGIQGLHPETRGSVYFTARAGCSSLRDNEIVRWVTPQPELPEFRPDEFVTTRETLFLLSKNVKGGTSAAALVSTLTTELRVAAERAGERRGGRIDPPLMLVMDEVANICRIADLPEQYSHLGSRSIVPIAILQSYAQGERVWGKAGMRELWGAATVKLVGSGVDDADFAEDMSRLVGDHDIDVVSYNRGGGANTYSTTTRRERILSAAEIRALPRNEAILLATGIRPALIRLLPWYESRRAAQIHAAERTAHQALIARVVHREAAA